MHNINPLELLSSVTIEPAQVLENMEQNLSEDLDFEAMVHALKLEVSSEDLEGEQELVLDGQNLASLEGESQHLPGVVPVATDMPPAPVQVNEVPATDFVLHDVSFDPNYGVITPSELAAHMRAAAAPQVAGESMPVQAVTTSAIETKQTQVLQPELLTKVSPEVPPGSGMADEVALADEAEKMVVPPAVTEETNVDKESTPPLLRKDKIDDLSKLTSAPKAPEFNPNAKEGQTGNSRDRQSSHDSSMKYAQISHTQRTTTTTTGINGQSFNQTLNDAIQVSVKQQEAWGRVFQEKIMMMNRNSVEKALIQIDPPELGPIEVLLEMEGKSANIQINTAHLNIKELVESQIQQLKDQFESDGVSLLDVTVEQQDSFEQGFESFKSQNPQEEVVVENKRQDSDGLLDIYV